MRKALSILVTIGAVLAVTGQAPAVAHTNDEGADTVRAWNEITVQVLVAQAVPVGEQPLNLAYVHRAVLDGLLQLRRPGSRTMTAALVTAAAHRVLVTNFPAQHAMLDAAYSADLATLPAGSARDRGTALGESAAQRLLRSRTGDGRGGPALPVPPPAPGVWRPQPPNTLGASSWLGGVRPFVLRSADEFRPGPPPALSSRQWARDFNETRVMGAASSTVRTATQTEVARFYADPPFVQNQRALRAYTVTHHLDVVGTARLFALADTASADAMIACWDAKYHYAFWRPITAVQLADSDGNAATTGDASWTPLLPTPNFPEYPSAHSCSTAAIATVVAGLNPTGRLDLVMDSTVTGTSRHYTSVPQLTQELANARIWGGLHFRAATTAGAALGESVGNAVLAAERGCEP